MEKVNYFYANKSFAKTSKRNAIYKTLYGFKDRISDRKAETTNKFDKVIAEEIILDIDNPNDIELAFKDTDKILKYLSDKYDAKANVYYSGKKGAHAVLTLKEPLELKSIHIDDKKSNIVNAYSQLLKELNDNLDIKSDIDESLMQTNRLITLPNVKKDNDKDRTYKICIGECRDLNIIRENGFKNKDVSNPIDYDNAKFIDHLKELDKKDVLSTLITDNKTTNKRNTNKTKKQSIKTDETKKNDVLTDEDKKFFVNLYNVLLDYYGNHNRHRIILVIASSLNGYLNRNQAIEVYNILDAETDITESSNYFNSFIDAFDNDSIPKNLGLIYGILKDNDNTKLFNEFKDVLKRLSKDNYNPFQDITNEYLNNIDRVTTHYNAFKSLLSDYDNDIESLFNDKLITYRNNSKPLFKGIVYSLSSSFGWSSQIVNINAPSGSGKTEYVKTLDSMMPNFLMKGGGTAKSLYREDDYEFNLKSVYLGDWGLITDDEEKESIIKIFRELMTDNISKYTITSSNNEDKTTFTLKADALSLFITELYTKKYQFGLGEQLVNKSQNININDLSKEDIIDICFLREIGDNDNEFRVMHRDYIIYLINNSQSIALNKEIIRELFDSDMRTIQMDIVYYKVFCIYFGYDANDKSNIAKYRQYFENKKLSKIEQTWLNLLENHFTKVRKEDINSEIPHDYIIKSTNTNVNEYRYFTVKRLKTYLNMRIKNNKTLRESVDYLTDILNVLLKKGYVGYTFEEDFGKERIYYLTSDDYYKEDNNDK